METIAKIEQLLVAIKEDAIKFYEKDNKSAGTRTRVACQELKKLAQELRIEIQEKKKA